MPEIKFNVLRMENAVTLIERLIIHYHKLHSLVNPIVLILSLTYFYFFTADHVVYSGHWTDAGSDPSNAQSQRLLRKNLCFEQVVEAH